MNTESSVRGSRGLLAGMVLVFSLGSGAAGLIYEAVWARLLVPAVGASVDAAAAVLASFMLGMGLGSYLFGRICDRSRSPLFIYACIEFGVAVSAVLASQLAPLFPGIVGIFSGGSGLSLALLRFIFSFIFLLIPSILLGAALPVLVRIVVTQEKATGRVTGALYAVNTLGAAGGCLLAGLHLLPQSGLRSATFTAAAVNITIAALALLLSRYFSAPGAEASRSVMEIDRPALLKRRAALVASFLLGLAVIGGEVVWTRLLSFVFGHDAYAFTAMLFMVLVGLAAGSGFYRWALSRLDQQKVAFASAALCALSITTSATIMSSAVLSSGRDILNLQACASLLAVRHLEFYRELAASALLVFLPAFFSAMAFPALVSLASSGRQRNAGRNVGAVLLANAAGSVTGAALPVAGVIRLLGLGGTLALLAVISSLGAAVVILASIESSRSRIIKVVLTLLLAVFIVRTGPGRLVGQELLLRAVGTGHQKLLLYKEGRSATVSVTLNKINGERQLFINSVNEVTSRLVHDQSFKLLGHLGPLLHPEPQRALVICLGAGITLGSLLTHPLKEVTVADLEPDVSLSIPYFRDLNHDPLSDPRVKVLVEDGRLVLASARDKFDLIVSDSTHPKSVDSWTLYTSEFYTAARSKLDEGGVFVQWLPLHGLSTIEFRSIVATFVSVFPEGSLWLMAGEEAYGQAAYAKLVGSAKPLKLRKRDIQEKLKVPGVKADLAPWGLDSADEILATFVASGPRLIQWTKGIQIQRDDRPFIAYATDISMAAPMEAAALNRIREPAAVLMEEKPSEEDLNTMMLYSRSESLIAKGQLKEADETVPGRKKIRLSAKEKAKGRKYYETLFPMYEDDGPALFSMGTMIAAAGYPQTAAMVLERAQELMPDHIRVPLNLALVYMEDESTLTRAVKSAKRAVDMAPDSMLTWNTYGLVLMSSGKLKEAAGAFRKSVSLDPDFVPALANLGRVLHLSGEYKDAVSVFQQALLMNPGHTGAMAGLGLAHEAMGEHVKAQQMFLRCITLDPFNNDCRYDLALALINLNHREQAARQLYLVLASDPDDVDALNELGVLLMQAGKLWEASGNLEKAVTIDPDNARAWFNLGMADRARGAESEAEKAFTKAFELDPDLEKLHEAFFKAKEE